MPKPDGPFQTADEQYLKWLGERLTLVPEELERREKKLREATPFEFLRATFFRWAQLWSKECSDLDEGVPRVLGVGDLHAENFGTWRDGEGRLVWGVNDFDECCYLPYSQDLVRMAASAWFALEEEAIEKEGDVQALPKKRNGQKPREAYVRKHHRELRERKAVQDRVEKRLKGACQAMLSGYCSGLDVPFAPLEDGVEKPSVGRKPFVLAEEHDWLREIVLNKLREKSEDGEDRTGQDAEDDFDKFWREMKELKPVGGTVPRSAWQALRASMPESTVPFSLGKREAGLGSLGRQRFTALVDDWCGAILIREAKALAPPAWNWHDPNTRDGEILYDELLRHAVRARDPWVSIHLGPLGQNWVVRRLAPDSGKVKLKDLPGNGKLANDLWCAMAREVANVHVPLGDVRADLLKRNENHPKWLFKAAVQMAKRTAEDWAEVYDPKEG